MRKLMPFSLSLLAASGSFVGAPLLGAGCDFAPENERSQVTRQEGRRPKCDPLVPSEGCLNWPPPVATACESTGSAPLVHYNISIPRLIDDHFGDWDRLQMDVYTDEWGVTAFLFRNDHFVTAYGSSYTPPIDSEEQGLVVSAFLSRPSLEAFGRRPCQVAFPAGIECSSCKLGIGLLAGMAAAAGAWAGAGAAATFAVAEKTGALIGAGASEIGATTLGQFVSCEGACRREHCEDEAADCAQKICQRQMRMETCLFKNSIGPNETIPDAEAYRPCLARRKTCLETNQ
jgi:hypothetical protein